jgi:glucokinase
MTVLAMDIGATKIAVGRTAPDGGVHDVRTAPVPPSGVWEACRATLLEVAGGEPVERIGVATPGPVDMAAGVAAPINIPEWRAGFPIGEAVQDLFPDAGVGFAIDGVCAALAEKWFGAARDVPDALVMVVSSGIGGGILVGGLTAVGRTGNAGHVGHLQVSGYDDECACGNRGCIEAVASGPSAVRWARRHGWQGSSGVELAAAAQAGERVAIDALHRAGSALGQAIASAAAMLDVDLVVVGGGFAQSGPALWGPLRESASRHARLGFLADLRVVPSMLREQATLVGAGLLVSTVMVPQQ